MWLVWWILVWLIWLGMFRWMDQPPRCTQKEKLVFAAVAATMIILWTWVLIVVGQMLTDPSWRAL